MDPQEFSFLKIQLWHKEIDQITKECRTHFSKLTPEELNWKPHNQTWSIAQNLAHVIRLNQSYFPLFTDLKKGSFTPPFLAKIPLLPELLGKLLLKTVQPASKKKIKTAPIWEPQEKALLNILATFYQHQKELKAHIYQMAEVFPKKAVIYSPANKRIVYPLETAIHILIAHEERHVKKAEELGVLIAKSAR